MTNYVICLKIKCTFVGSEKEFSSILFKDVSIIFDEPNRCTFDFKLFIKISKFSIELPKFTTCNKCTIK